MPTPTDENAAGSASGPLAPDPESGQTPGTVGPQGLGPHGEAAHAEGPVARDASWASGQSGERPPRLVVFDWGGVILQICRTFEEGCIAAGVAFEPEALGGDERRDVRRANTRRFQIGELTASQYFRLQSEATGGVYTPDQIAAIHDAWLLCEYEGAGELVDELNALPGVETGMLSNTNERHWIRQRESPYGPAYDSAARLRHRHASHILGCAKPDPSIYQRFEQGSGMVGRDILFFDDLAENVEAARAAGWRSVQIDYTGDTVEQMRRVLRGLGIGVRAEA